MKTRTKALLLSLCAIALVAVTVVGTLAFLVSEKEVKNTFTVGDVQIKLDETVVNPDGTPTTEPATRAEHGNEYHLIPGETYTKDPIVTVLAGSEASYVRMLVTLNNYSDLKDILGDDFLPQYFVEDTWDAAKWVPQATIVEDTANDTATYEFRYVTTVAKADEDTELEPLFTTFKCPTQFNNEDLKKVNDPAFEITVVGHAIQAATFDDADAAWAAFDAQKAANQ